MAFTVSAVGSDAFIAPVIAAGNDAAVPAAGGIGGCLPTGQVQTESIAGRLPALQAGAGGERRVANDRPYRIYGRQCAAPYAKIVNCCCRKVQGVEDAAPYVP